jgi:histidine triad (HIT) family protein
MRVLFPVWGLIDLIEMTLERETCLFCKIVDKKIPCKMVYEDDSVIAIEDIHPQAPVHLLVIPNKHIESLSNLKQQDETIIGQLGHLLSIVSILANKMGLQGNGFRTVINSGAGAGQSVFHLHVHLLGGRPFIWPPG